MRKLKDRKGLSLIEALLVLAILAVLVSLGINSYNENRKDLKLMELDDIARQIYDAAQNELTADKASGLMPGVYTCVTQEGSIIRNHPDGVSGLFSVTNSDRSVIEILGGDSIDAVALDGYFVIELDPSAGYVYSVFYSREDFTGTYDASGTPREKARRREHSPMIGYYAGSGAEAQPSLKGISLKTEIVNSEELYVRITGTADPGELGADPHLYTTLLLEVADESGNAHSFTADFRTGDNEDGIYTRMNYLTGEFEAEVLLDSLIGGYDFKSICPELTGGENITATATITYSNGSDAETESDFSVSNSYYEYNDGKGNVGVQYVRHLENLNLLSVPEAETGVVITQTDDIDFGLGTGNYRWVFNTGKGAMYDEGSVPEADRPNSYFTPVSNDELNGRTEKTSYRGCNAILKNFSVNTVSEGGIFGAVDNWSFEYTYVVDPVIAGSNAGALAGYAVNSDFIRCGAYLDSANRAENVTHSVTALTGDAGGLVGKAEGGSFRESFGSVYAVYAGDNAGGLAGSISGTSVSSCYGNSIILQGDNVGGFSGSTKASSVSYCYAISDSLLGTDVSAGFSARISGSDIRNSYTVIGTVGSEAAGSEIYGFSPENSGVSNCLYCPMINTEASTWTFTGEGAGERTSGVLIGAAFGADPEHWKLDTSDIYSRPYNTTGDFDYMNGAAYPYPRLAGNVSGTLISVIHYGDWPDGQYDATYKVIYDMNAGTDPVSNVTEDLRKYAQNARAYFMGTGEEGDPSPVRLGYKFDHWNTKADDSGDLYKPGDSVLMTGDVTVYAIWELQPYYINLNVYLDDEKTTEKGLSIKLYDHSSHKYITAAAYKSDGLYTASVVNGTYDVYFRDINTGITVTVNNANASAKLELYSLSVQFRKDNENWTDCPHKVTRIDNLSTGESFTAGLGLAEGRTRPIIVLKGTSWDIHIQEKGETSAFKYHTAGNVTAERIINANYYTVNYHPNIISAGLSNMPAPMSVTVRSGEGINLYADSPKCEEALKTYYFKEWNTETDGSGISYNPGGYVYVTGRVDLYAQWLEGEYMVTYHENFIPEASDNVTVPKDERVYAAGEGAVIMNYAGLLDGEAGNEYKTAGELYRQYYIFIGWNTRSDGSGQYYAPGDRLRMTRDVDLYAQWTYQDNYTVIYDGNGEEEGFTPNTTFSGTVNSITLNDNQYSRFDYVFMGWSPEPQSSYNGGDITWQYTDKQIISGSDLSRFKLLAGTGNMPQNTIRLYAVWQYKRTYTVTFDLEKMNSGDSPLVAFLGEDYKAKLECMGGYNPPESADDITVYVDGDRNGVFNSGDKLKAMSNYTWDPYTMTLTIPAQYVKGNIKIVAGAVAGKHTLEFYKNYPGSTTDSKVDSTDSRYEYGTYINMRDGITYSGYVFTGWNTEKDGSGDNYMPGDVFLVEHNQRFYAQWKKTGIVGAGIVNGYQYFAADSSESGYYYLLKGETQTTADGETLRIINNGGRPHYYKTSDRYYYHYMVLLNKGENKSNYRFYYSTNNGSTWTEFTGSAAKIDITSTGTSGLAAIGNGTGVENSKKHFEYGSSSEFDYYLYQFNNGTVYMPKITNIKVEYRGAVPTTNIFDFENSPRPFDVSAGATIGSPETGWSWSGVNSAYVMVTVQNGNVPVLDREYANFFKKSDCRAEFTVTPDANGYTFSGVVLRNEKGVSVTTMNTLYSVTNGVYTFNKAAMAELEPGDYTVTFNYYKSENGVITDYENDPSFVLHVYNESITGYRHIKMNVTETLGAEGHVQFADIAFCSDYRGINLYKFADAALVYDCAGPAANIYEDAWQAIDNNPRTKYCGDFVASGSKNANPTYLIIDTGDGYQFSPNIYGYLSYRTGGDSSTYSNRSPVKFTYRGRNDAPSGSSAYYSSENGWTLISDRTVSNDTPALKQNMTIVGPFLSRNYSLTYDLNASDASCAGLASHNIASGYGDQVLCYEIPTRYGYYFLGWAESSKATQPQYETGEHYNLVYDVVLYAVWSRVKPSMALVYNANLPAGSRLDDLNKFPSNSYGYGNFKVSSMVPELKGYRFVKWHHLGNVDNDTSTSDPKADSMGIDVNLGLEYVLKSNGSKGIYDPEDNIELLRDSTLYAEWEPAYRITLPKGEGYSISTDEEDEYVTTSQSEKFIFKVITEEGYDDTAPAITVPTGTADLSIIDNHDGTYTCTLSRIRKDTEVSVAATANLLTIRITGEHISCQAADSYRGLSGTRGSYTVTVQYGNNYSFTATPDSGFNVAQATGEEENGKTYNISPYKTSGNRVTYNLIHISDNMTVDILASNGVYTLKLDPNGAAGTMNEKEYYLGQKITLPDDHGLTAPAGTVFAGWNTMAAGTGNSYKAGQVITSATLGINTDGAEKTLFAIWKTPVKVNFHVGEGIKVSLTVPYGTDADAPELSGEDIPLGMSFRGWYTKKTGGEEADLSEVTEDKDVYARFEYLNYSISYRETGSAANPNPVTYTAADSVTLNDPVLSGYEFLGWTGEGVSVPTKGVTIPAGSTGDREYTANWKALYRSISLLANNTGSYITTTDGSAQVLSGNNSLESIKAPTCYYKRYLLGSTTYYKVTAYYIDAAKTVMIADGEGRLLPDAAYSGINYTDSDGNWIYDGDAAFYASWSSTGDTYHKLRLDPNGGSGDLRTVYYRNGGNDVEPGLSAELNPSKEDYVFDGWFTSKDGGTRVINAKGSLLSGTPYTNSSGAWNTSSDITLYAHWRKPVIYVRTSSLSNGEYIIVNSDMNYALTNNNNSVGRTGVELTSLSVNGHDYDDCIETDDTSIVWTVSDSKITSGGRYLRTNNNNLQISTTNSNNSWTYTDRKLKNNNNRYLRYTNNAFSANTSNSSNTIYLYKKVELE